MLQEIAQAVHWSLWQALLFRHRQDVGRQIPTRFLVQSAIPAGHGGVSTALENHVVDPSRRDFVAPRPVCEIDWLGRKAAPNSTLSVGSFAVAGRAMQKEEIRTGAQSLWRAKQRPRYRQVAVFLGQLSALTTPKHYEQGHQPCKDSDATPPSVVSREGHLPALRGFGRVHWKMDQISGAMEEVTVPFHKLTYSRPSRTNIVGRQDGLEART